MLGLLARNTIRKIQIAPQALKSADQSQYECRRWFEIAALALEKARILDGKGVAAAWQEDLAKECSAVHRQIKRAPSLAVILAGERADSRLYVTRKLEAAAKVGISAWVVTLPESVSQEKMEETVRQVCGDKLVDGVLLQLPLPHQLDEDAIIECFDPDKDVDGFHPLNIGRLLARGRAIHFVPATALGCIELLRRSGIDFKGKTAVVVGDSNVVGLPLAMLLRRAGVAALTLCHRVSFAELFKDARSPRRAEERALVDSCLPRIPGPLSVAAAGPHFSVPEALPSTGPSYGTADQPPSGEFVGMGYDRIDSGTMGAVAGCRQGTGGEEDRGLCKNEVSLEGEDGVQKRLLDMHKHMAEVTRSADILVVAVGHAGLVRKDWVKQGAVVVDVGINVISDSGQHLRVVGDVVFDEVSEVASAITPVPGGVGPMTIAAALYNVLLAAGHAWKRNHQKQ